jgi:hypothetical protein
VGSRVTAGPLWVSIGQALGSSSDACRLHFCEKKLEDELSGGGILQPSLVISQQYSPSVRSVSYVPYIPSVPLSHSQPSSQRSSSLRLNGQPATTSAHNPHCRVHGSLVSQTDGALRTPVVEAE